MKKTQISLLLALLGVVFLFTQCTEDSSTGDNNNQPDNKTEVEIEITDAPIDNAEISGVFVTVAAIKLDGETYEGFGGRKTINVYALQNGNTEVLGIGKMNARTYSNITLVLDTEVDENGNAPGCYVMTANGTKDDLYANASGMQEIVITKTINTAEESRNRIVLDFDLRKTIDAQATSSGSMDYEFKSNATLNSSIRAVKRSHSGNVNGTISGNMSSTGKVVVYAYKKGTYSQNSQANSSTEFSGAVTSCNADAQGNYTLSFMEEGEYEIICASYEDSDNDGQFELQGTLALDILLGLDTSLVTVSAESSISLNIEVLGVISL